jgi:hypothetical protein
MASGVAVTILVSEAPAGVEYRIFILDDDNWLKFKAGITPRCMNNDCLVKRTGDFQQAWGVGGLMPGGSYHLLFSVTDDRSKPFDVLISVNALSDVYLLKRESWQKVKDSPAGCSNSSWPTNFNVLQQHGILYLLSGVSTNWTVIRSDVVPAEWSVSTSDGGEWIALIDGPQSLRTITWFLNNTIDRFQLYCQVVYDFVGIL